MPHLPSSVVKHSVSVDGHRTSITLEKAFWDGLKDIAHLRNVTVGALISEIDATREGNLSSAIRVFVLQAALSRRDGAIITERA